MSKYFINYFCELGAAGSSSYMFITEKKYIIFLAGVIIFIIIRSFSAAPRLTRWPSIEAALNQRWLSVFYICIHLLYCSILANTSRCAGAGGETDRHRRRWTVALPGPGR